MSGREVAGWTVGLALAAGLGALAPAGRGEEVKYPHISLATGYKVDPAWPRKPGAVRWGEMSGVAVDKQDRVYLYTRAKPPVQVYDAGGAYLYGWGADTIKTAHHIKIDPEGNVWVADIGHHTVQKYTPRGKLLLTLGTSDSPGRDARHFNMPTDMAVTPGGDVFVSDGYGN